MKVGYIIIIFWLKKFGIDANQQDRNLIVNGNTVVKGRYSYATSLQYGRNHICGASLIAPDLVLTAAHCFDKPALIQNLRVVVGEYHLQDLSDSGETMYIESIKVHPQYLVTNTYVDYDVMILKLTGLSLHQPVRLNTKNSIPSNEAQLTVMGWGSLDTNGKYMSNILQEIELTYIPRWKCLQLGIPTVTENMMCSFDQDFDNFSEDSCYGDSGGPLIIKDEHGADLQVGIVSYGAKVCAEKPGINMRISRVFQWIRERTCEMSAEPPTYFDCHSFTIPDGSSAPSMKPSTINRLKSPSLGPTPTSSPFGDESQITSIPLSVPKTQLTLGPSYSNLHVDEDVQNKNIDDQNKNIINVSNGTLNNGDYTNSDSNNATSILSNITRIGTLSVMVAIISNFFL